MDSVIKEDEIYFPRALWRMMLDEVERNPVEEVCGLVSGQGKVAKAVYPITNELHSSNRFRMAPVEQLKAFQSMEASDSTLLAIYHSHPNGPSEPSPTDLEEFAYPGVYYLIWSKRKSHWFCKGFSITNHKFYEIKIVLE